MSRSSDAAGGPSLYDRLGGKAAVAAAVDRFYERLLADPDLRPFFAQANLSRLRKRQGQFFAQALCGPAGYKGPGMQKAMEDLGITPRELEILGLIAQGLSNKEIADRVHVSENTVKTHSSRVFDKLGARRRTQAVQLGKELRLIP